MDNVTVLQKGRDKKTVGQQTIYTQQLTQYLGKAKIGETISYEAMTEVIGLSTRPHGDGYGYQLQARKNLEKVGMVFEAVRKIGIRRLSPEETANSSLNLYLKAKKSIIKKHTGRAQAVVDDYDSLSDESKIRLNTTRTLLAMDNETTNKKKIDRIEEVAKSVGIIGFNQTIEFFKQSET